MTEVVLAAWALRRAVQDRFQRAEWIRVKDVVDQPLVSLKLHLEFQLHRAGRISQAYPDLAVSLARRDAYANTRGILRSPEWCEVQIPNLPGLGLPLLLEHHGK